MGTSCLGSAAPVMESLGDVTADDAALLLARFGVGCGVYVHSWFRDFLHVVHGRFRSHRTFRERHCSQAKAGRLLFFSGPDR